MAAAPIICLIVLVLVATFTDLRTGIIPNSLCYSGMLTGLAFGWVSGEPLTHALGLFVGLLPGLIMWRHGSLGGGDVKLFGAIGALGGGMFVLQTWLFAFVVALAAVMVKALRARVLMDTVRVLMLAAFAPVPPRVRADFELPFEDGHSMPLAPAIALVTLAQIAVLTW